MTQPASRIYDFDPNYLLEMLGKHLAALNEVTATQREMQVEIRQIHEALSSQSSLAERVTRIEEQTLAVQKESAAFRTTLQWAVGFAASSLIGIVGIVISLLSKH